MHAEVVSVTTGALNPGQTIAAFAEAKGAELLVVGSRGIGAVAGCEGLRSSVTETGRDQQVSTLHQAETVSPSVMPLS